MSEGHIKQIHEDQALTLTCSGKNVGFPSWPTTDTILDILLASFKAFLLAQAGDWTKTGHTESALESTSLEWTWC